MPRNFPSLSWPTGVAYDSKHNHVLLTSLGGEGFLYRFDVTQQRWLDFRSLSQIDINFLTYDAHANRYVAWTSDASLLFIAADGTPQHSIHLIDRLPGFKRLYDTGNERPPSLQLVAQGDRIALLRVNDGVVEMIWYYDAGLDISQLTYKHASATAAP